MSEEEAKEEVKTEEEEKESEITPDPVERTPTPPHPLITLAEQKQSETIIESAKEVSEQDLLVCGKCHKVYYYLEGFQEHKKNEKCEENDELKEVLKDEKKPQIWAFTLWKNTKFKDRKEEEEGDKDPTSWSLYKKWCNLEDREKESWIKAAENIQALFEIATTFEQAKHAINEVKIQEKVESEDHSMDSVKDEKDPLGDESEQETTTEKGKNKKAILKPVQLNNKVAANKKPKTYRKAVKTGGDPNVELPVEKIVAKRYNPRRKTFEYLIKWEDFDAEKNSWEPVASLEHCKIMVEEFEKHWQIHKAQLKLQKSLEKKMPKKQSQEIIQLTAGGRPQRTSKQKALNQVKQWCGNMEADENSSNKRVFSDDSDDDDSFEKRMKYEEYSSDSENDTPLVTIKRIQKSQNNGIEKKKIEKITLPENILIPDSKGIVRINQKQIPSLSSGVYVMSKTAGIIKLDTKASKLATSCGQTLLKVAPKIGQTSIKVIKKEVTNGSTMSKTANILRKPPLRNYSGRVYMQKKQNTQQQQLAAAAKKVTPDVITPDKEEEESDGVEELEFPTDLPIPAPDSPPAAFTLCPLTGKVLDKNGEPIEPEPQIKIEEPQNCSNDNTVALDNLVKLAAADILKDLTDDPKPEKESDISNTNEGLVETIALVRKECQDSDIAMHIDKPVVQSTSMETKPKTSDSILSTALTNANITSVRRVSGPVHRTHTTHKTILNRTMGQRSAPQAIITRITPGNNSMQRSRVMAPKQKSEAPIIRKRIIHSTSNPMANRSLVRKIGDNKVYPSPKTNQMLQQVVTTFVATPTSENTVISMPSLVDTEAVPILMTTQKVHHQAKEMKAPCEANLLKKEVQMEESAVPTTSADTLSQLALSETETPLLITGEDGTIYQVAGQNEEGQTILITQGEDGEQQCLLVAPENAGLINQALMKPEEETVAVPEPEVDNPPNVSMQAPLEITTEAEEPAADDSQVVAQIVSANPPSPGGTRKVVLLLPDGNFMMTEVTAEQYAALELDK